MHVCGGWGGVANDSAKGSLKPVEGDDMLGSQVLTQLSHKRVLLPASYWRKAGPGVGILILNHNAI